MTKQGGGFFQKWQKRWFILTRARNLHYYTDKSRRDHKGTINLDSVKEVSSTSSKNIIVIYPLERKGKTYQLQCSSQKSHDVWKDAIRTLADGQEWPRKKKARPTPSPNLTAVAAQPQVVINNFQQPQYQQPQVVYAQPSGGFNTSPVFISQPMYQQPMYQQQPIAYQQQFMLQRTHSAPQQFAAVPVAQTAGYKRLATIESTKGSSSRIGSGTGSGSMRRHSARTPSAPPSYASALHMPNNGTR